MKRLTPREWLLVVLCVVVLLFGRIVPSVGTAAPGEQVLAQLSGVNISSVDFQSGGDGYVERVTIRYADGAVLEYDRLDTAPPSATPTPTSPATATASSAPGTPTIAPIYTATATPTLDATPTRESTPSPTTTPAPTAIPKVCELRATTTIRIRFSPTTSAAITGFWQQGETRAFDAFWQPDESGYLWGHHAGGWSAVYYWPGFEWLIAGTAEAGLCRDVEGWPWNLAPPEPIARPFLDGFHSLAGEGAGVLLAPDVVSRYKLLKCLDGGFALCEQAKAANPEMLTIYRTFQHDCPPLWVYTSPESWWSMIAPSLPSGADYYEIQNECDPPIEYVALWAEFSIQMALIIERERGAALLAFSSGPGNPDFPYWRAMWAYVDWTQSHGPAPNGLYHGIATHSSAYAPASVILEPGSWINNPYIAGREKIVCDLATANNYGVSCAGLTWILTEAGVTDGYQGNKQLFSCEQKAAAYKETARRKQADGVTGFTWWSVGLIGRWTSDHDCVRQMVQ